MDYMDGLYPSIISVYKHIRYGTIPMNCVIRFLIAPFRKSRLKRNTYRVAMKNCIKQLVVGYVVNGGDRDVPPDEIFELASIIFSKPKGYEWSLEAIHDTLSYVTYPKMYSENLIDIFVTIVDHASQIHV